MNITHISEYKSRDTISLLTDLLHRAQHGRLPGVVLVAKTTDARRHRIGVTGDYWTDPGQGLAAAVRLCYRLNALAEEAERMHQLPDSAHAPFDE